MYKFIIIIVALLLTIADLVGQDTQDQILFDEASWSVLLKKAKASDKLIFVDAYTTWCGPCKTMAKEVFTDSTVAILYNGHFINTQIDAERGEGTTFARKYRIFAYPSLLFIDGNGEVVHRATGFHNVEDFKLLGETAISPAGGLREWNRRYKQGERSPEFVQKLILAKYAAMEEDYLEIAESYMRGQKDWSSLPNMQLIFTLIDDPNSSWFNYMVDHRADFDLLFGRKAVAAKLQHLFLKKPLGESGDPMKEVDRFYSKVYPDLAPKLTAHFKMNYYRTLGQMDEFAKAADRYLSTYGSTDADELNNIAWTFFEYVDNSVLLKKAVAWVEKSIELDPGYHNLDTLAHLLYKLGKLSKAKKVAKQAIWLAAEEDIKLSSTEALLAQIRDR